MSLKEVSESPSKRLWTVLIGPWTHMTDWALNGVEEVKRVYWIEKSEVEEIDSTDILWINLGLFTVIICFSCYVMLEKKTMYFRPVRSTIDRLTNAEFSYGVDFCCIIDRIMSVEWTCETTVSRSFEGEERQVRALQRRINAAVVKSTSISGLMAFIALIGRQWIWWSK